MAIEDADYLADFFSLDDFGTAATYTPAGGSASTVNGIFDNPQASRTASEMMDVTMPSPQFVCRTVDVANVAEDDALVVNSVPYVIRVVLTDGTGVTTMMLEKA